MPFSQGYPQLQPEFILGTQQWVSTVAEQMVGADIDRINQLRDHMPFLAMARGETVVIPRVERLGTASFSSAQSVVSDRSTTTLMEPPEQVRLTSIEGSVEMANYPIAVQSFDIDQLELQIEFKKIAIRIAFWEQFFRPQRPNGFRGLPDLVHPTQRVAVSGALTLEGLDVLAARVTEADSEMDRKVMVMNQATFIEFVRLVRQTSASLTYTSLNGRRYASHNGIPVLVCDYIPLMPDEDGDRTQVWCMTLGMEDKGVFGVVPEDVGESGLIVDLAQGALESSTTVHRVRWYCTVVLGHIRGLAVLDQVHLHPIAGGAPGGTGAEVVLFDNTNTGAVVNAPPQPTLFTLSREARVTYLMTYHWNDGLGATPPAGEGQRIRDSAGAEYGPFPVVATSGSGHPSVNWISRPDVNLPAGEYTILDPDPGTWSHNVASGSSGFAAIRGTII